jgi:hypothetical protein
LPGVGRRCIIVGKRNVKGRDSKVRWSDMNNAERRLAAARLWSSCDTSRGHSECWPWTNPSVDGHGYGVVHAGGRHYGAHRVAYMLATGEDIVGEIIRHSCDNPKCCNPAHLLSGDHAANMRDMAERNRAHGKILSDEMGLEILSRFRNGESQSLLGRSFGVHRSTIFDIVRRRYKWADKRFD